MDKEKRARLLLAAGLAIQAAAHLVMVDGQEKPAENLVSEGLGLLTILSMEDL